MSFTTKGERLKSAQYNTKPSPMANILKSQHQNCRGLPVEFSETEKNIFYFIFENKLTSVSPQRLSATILAAKYVIDNEIEGDFVECGVWRGGNSLAAKMVFEAYGSSKQVYLFDTFTGMAPPTDADLNHRGEPAKGFWKGGRDLPEGANPNIAWRYKNNKLQPWAYASLSDVMHVFHGTIKNNKQVHFQKGRVEETLQDKNNLPKAISALRLDTDFYESTKVEMEILYPMLSLGGVLMIDDYGHWQGAKKAVDEFFKNPNNKRPFFQVTDYTQRTAIKIT